MKAWFPVSFLVMLSILIISFGGPSAEEIKDVSIVELIADGKGYDGSHVRVIGYVRLEFEGNAVYLSQDDEKHGISKNGLWLEISDETEKRAQEYNGQHCLVEGIFNSANKGHMGLWSGAIENINPAIAPRPSAVGGMVVLIPAGGRDVAPIGASSQVPWAMPVGLHRFQVWKRVD